MNSKKICKKKRSLEIRKQILQIDSQPHQIIPQLIQNHLDGSLDVASLKSAAIQHDGHKWIEFLLQWAVRAEQQHSQTINKIEGNKNEVQEEAHNLVLSYKQENQVLRDQIGELKESFYYLQERR